MRRHERTVHAKEKFESLKREGILVDIPQLFTFHVSITNKIDNSTRMLVKIERDCRSAYLVDENTN